MDGTDPEQPHGAPTSVASPDWGDSVPWDPSDILPSSCVGNAEFVPLGRDRGSPWASIDPEARYVFWVDEQGLTERWFRWSQEQGITVVGEYVDTYVLPPSSDGSTLVGVHWAGETPSDAFRWTISGGTTPLDFIPFALNASGDVLVGARQQQLIRWSVNGGTQIVNATAGKPTSVGPAVTKGLDIIVGSDIDGRVFRWTQTEGSVDLGALGGPRLHASVHGISANGEALFGIAFDEGDIIRAFRWTAADGTRWLDVPADMPDDASIVPASISDDGRVIVGLLSLAEPSYSYPVRWSEATGMQVLVPRERPAHPQYMSRNGDVVLGEFFDPDGNSPRRGFRWTVATGLEEIDAPEWRGIGADGDLTVGTNAQGPFVHTYGKLAGTQPEILHLAPLGALPEGWSEPRLQGTSEDGRMLLGRARDPSGRLRLWLLHPSERCAGR